MSYTLLFKIQVGRHLSISEEASRRGGGGEPISVTARILATIRWLSGGCWSDICGRFGIARGTLYKVIWEVMGALVAGLDDSEPGIDPSSPQQLASLSAQFNEVCGRNYLQGKSREKKAMGMIEVSDDYVPFSHGS